jgi:hypothetical protein
MPDQAFRSLFTETENVRWDPVNQVQSRARRRTAGQAVVVAGAVVVALVSGGIAVAQVRPEPVTPPVATSSPATPPTRLASPSPSAQSPSRSPSTPSRTSTKPSPPPVTDITAAMMLRPQDVGSGYTANTAENGDWTFEFNASVLDCPRGTRPEPVDEHWRALRKGRPQDENLVAQHLARYSAGAAARYLDRIRERVSACSPSDERSVRIAAEGFAGDDAVLVVFDHGGGSLAKIVLVREGDLLTEIYSKPVRSDSACRELGRNAAARF